MSNINKKYNMLYNVSFLAAMLFLTFQACSAVKTTARDKDEKTKKPASIIESDDRKTAEGAEKEKTPKISEFILGPGDSIEIAVYRNDDLTRTVRIDPSGKIIYPLIGDIQAAGTSIFQLRDKIREGLLKYIVDPNVYVGIVSIQNQKVIVLGEVRNPGFFQIETSLNVLEAISKAGGITLDGKLKSVLLIRGGMKKPELVTLNLANIFEKGDFTQNVMLQRGDIIYVPRSFIADVDRFFAHLSTIVSPLLSLETGYFIGQQIWRNSGGGAAFSAD